MYSKEAFFDRVYPQFTEEREREREREGRAWGGGGGETKNELLSGTL